MGEIKEVTKSKQIRVESGELANPETGELLDVSDGALYKVERTNMVKINYKQYVYVDTERIRLSFQKGVSQSLMGFLIMLSSDLMMEYNICMIDKETPHTTKSIADLVGETEQSARRKLNDLKSLGLLYEGPLNRFSKVFVLNPHFVKKGVEFNKRLTVLFDDIKKEGITPFNS